MTTDVEHVARRCDELSHWIDSELKDALVQQARAQELREEIADRIASLDVELSADLSYPEGRGHGSGAAQQSSDVLAQFTMAHSFIDEGKALADQLEVVRRDVAKADEGRAALAGV